MANSIFKTEYQLPFKKGAPQEEPLSKAQGFVTVFVALWIPVLITFVLFIGSVGKTLVHYNKGLSLCRYELLKTQKKALRHLKILLNMNKKATKLRRKRKVAKRALKMALASKLPKAIFAAKAHLIYVIFEQTKLKKDQEFQKWVVQDLGKQMKLEYEKKFKKHLNLYGENLKITPLSLAVMAAPPLSLTPNHYPEPFFKQRQKISSQWTLYAFSFLNKSPLQKHLAIKGHCSATIYKQNKKWKISLI